MRKSKQAAAETRDRIVMAASAEFRRNGIDRTGLNDLMAAAGLTHGGFYRHFETKNELVAEAAVVALESLLAKLATSTDEKGRRNGLSAIASVYLSPEHRDHPEIGCLLAANGSELARSDESTRAVATEGFLRLVDLIAKQCRVRKDVAERRAIVAVSTLLGAMMMSRIVTDPALSDTILDQAAKYVSGLDG
jgi:TetR/AcrR family transcriptional repressor of nem operon